MQREHILELPVEDLVTDLDDESARFIVQAPPCMVGIRRGFLQRRIGGNHLLRDQVLAYVEILQ